MEFDAQHPSKKPARHFSIFFNGVGRILISLLLLLL